VSAFVPRTTVEVTRELARIAARTEAPGIPSGHDPARTASWAEVLFDGGDLDDPSEPSQALLQALVALQPGLDVHLAGLAATRRRWWLEDHLGLLPLPPVGDLVVAVATAEPDAAPVVVPSGTELKGGRTSGGTDRIYTTDDTLTVLDATVVGVRGYRTGDHRDHVAGWSGPAVPVAPLATHTPAPHHLDLVTDLIAFEGGSLIVTVRFDGVEDGIADQLEWWYSTAEGLARARTGSPPPTPNQVVLELDDACQPLALDGTPVTFLRGALPEGSFPTGALTFRFARVEVTAERNRIPADGGFYNDGALDVTKEFQPFGPTPRRGDSFYVRADEALGKPLAVLKVHLTLLDAEQKPMTPTVYAYPIQQAILTQLQQLQMTFSWAAESAKEYETYLATTASAATTTALWWQQYRSGAWENYAETGGTFGGDLPGSAPPKVGGDGSSEPTTVAGVDGRFIRVFLAQGDFGWNAYLGRLAAFAAAAAGEGELRPNDLLPPTPPIVSLLRISYTTPAVRVTDLRTTNGWARRSVGDLPEVQPFLQPLTAVEGRPGAVAFGVTIDAGTLGRTLSMFVQVEAADACPSLGHDHDVRWQYWSDTGWRSVYVVDATAGLRQDGLVRLVAPRDWVDGCPELDATDGRWLRAVVTTPGQVGTLTAIHPDAVLATHVADGDPNRPRPAGAIKGPRTKLAGIKKLTNPAVGLAGRDAEPDDRYVVRASQVTRHRDRAVQAWDYEHLVLAEEPQVAAVRCLPHTDADGRLAPGRVALVVVPRTDDLAPVPSVTLAERIDALLGPRTPMHATVAVVCPVYVTIGVAAQIVLVRGVAAAEAVTSLHAAIDGMLHPLTASGPAFGRPLYRSTVVAFLEGRPEVDHVESLTLTATAAGTTISAPERVDVDPLRGLVASSGVHDLGLEERL
jgi:hypothetical protein